YGDGVGNGGDNVLGADDADVVVGDERERASAGGGTGVQHDRAGVGDRHRAAGDNRVERVELGDRETLIGHSAEVGQLGRYADALRAGEDLADRDGHVRSAVYGRAIFGDALAEQVHDAVAIAGEPVLAGDLGH